MSRATQGSRVVALAPAAAVPAILPAFALPLMPDELRLAVDHWLEPCFRGPVDLPDAGTPAGRYQPNPMVRMAMVPRPLSADARVVAREMLRALLPLLQPAGRDVFDAWLSDIAAGFRFAPTADDLDERVRAAGVLLDDMPLVAFTRESQKALLRAHSSKGLPGAGEMAEVLEAAAAPVQRRVRALRALLDHAPAATTTEPPLDDAERERFRIRLRELAREIGGGRSLGTRTAANASPGASGGASGLPHWSGAIGAVVGQARAAREATRP